jgi:hypothetical protein
LAVLQATQQQQQLQAVLLSSPVRCRVTGAPSPLLLVMPPLLPWKPSPARRLLPLLPLLLLSVWRLAAVASAAGAGRAVGVAA